MGTCSRTFTATGAILAVLVAPMISAAPASAATSHHVQLATQHTTAAPHQHRHWVRSRVAPHPKVLVKRTVAKASPVRLTQTTTVTGAARARQIMDGNVEVMFRSRPITRAGSAGTGPAAVAVAAPAVAAAPPARPAAPAAPAAPPAPAAPSGGAEFGAQFHGMWSSYSDAQRDMVLATMAAHGVKSVRIDVSWAMLQPKSADSYDPWGVGFVDSVITRARAHGLDPIITLWLTPGWANGGAGERTLPTNPSDYARAAQWAAHRWAGKVSGWEVWNEPNSPDFMVGASPSAYAQLLKAAYPALHAGDPATKVVFGGTQYVDVDWVRKTFAAGATGSFDAMGVHPYMGMADASPTLADDGTIWRMNHVPVLHELLVANGRGAAPLWFTEFGWSVQNTPADAPNWNRGVTAAQQAQYLQETVRMVRATMPYVTRMYWYEDLVGIEGGYNGGYGLVRPDGSATLALKAVGSA